ncbi:MAG: prevent-host-death family protein [Hyphomonadaceae bacterium]|nr:MAG: prevent-host-death family protein [Hyphomonadaceae bacterium]KAF0183012.1 MAG: prevent-host-death family protein [Hyphomonadaceae bacterium]
MQTATASDFSKKFGQYREIVQREPIAVTSHDRVSGYFISAIEYEEFSRLKSMMPKAYAVEELDDDTLNAIMASEMDARHDHLNKLME